MNIGVDIKAIKNGSTGIGKYTRCILDELQRIDSENRYYLFECRESDYIPVNPNWSKVSQNRKLPGTLWLQLVLPKLLRKHAVDILWAPEQICPVLGLPRAVKVVTTVLDFTFLRYPQTCQTSVLLIQKLFFQPTVKRSDALVPLSDHVKRELIELYPRARSASKIVRTVGVGTDDRRGAGRHRPGRENFLFFPGNMEPRKNLTRLIRALEIVNASGIEIDLHICGPRGWKNSDLRKQMESSPIRDRVKRLGYLSEEDLLNQYLTCKAVVYPSLYEGFGMPVLEALMLDTPVLTSKGTVMEEIAGRSALYFDPDSVESIAGALIDFLRTGAAGVNTDVDKERLSKYSWRRAAEDLLGVFGELMSAKKKLET